MSFLNSKAWKNKREHILRRDKYTDQLELRAGRRIPATLVHHILPRDRFPEYSLQDWNLISISEQTHRALHTPFGELTDAGTELMRRTAHEHGIKLSKLTLVIGGKGKRTAVKSLLKLYGGLAYDADSIAAAFMLSDKTDSKAAHKMANNMFKAFAINARRYAGRVYMIRSEPSLQDIEAIEPDEIIICENNPVADEIRSYAEDNNIPVKVLEQ